jgi:hypothetical protein
MPGQKGQPRSLIVRIYRHGYSTLSGVVEDAASGAQEPFANLEETSPPQQVADDRW